MADIVNKLWGFCHTLRHDGVDYGDYIEQLTYLLFLKMADEKNIKIPTGEEEIEIEEKGKTVKKKQIIYYNWESLKTLSGTELTDHYADALRHLREGEGILGKIFTLAMPRIINPVNLKRLINMIDEEDWSSMDVDVKGEAFEGLLERSANEGKKGAGQYFTPRPLIRSIVRVMKPDPRVNKTFTICDPACGTGGFLVLAYEWLMNLTKGALEREDAKRIKEKTYYGYELVARPARLAMMNLFLHGVTTEIKIGDTIYQPFDGKKFDCILTNPPFGTKGANQVPERDDFTIATSSKQLNFVQHYLSALKPGGRAAVVLPDNVLFQDKAAEVFKILMQDCNLHTILRLPRGTFTPYAQGVKANVIFFQKGLPTENIWIYDGRSNVEGITKKDRPLTDKYFEEFEKCYGKDANGQSQRKDLGMEGRFRKFHISEIKARDYNLDIAWLKDETLEDSDNLPQPQVLATEAITELEFVVDELKEVLNLLEAEDEQ